MNYYLNPELSGAYFMVPGEVADKHLRLAGAVQLKVLLYALKNITCGFTPEQMCSDLNIPAADAGDAMKYWVANGIFLEPKSTEAPAKQSHGTAVAKSARPTRSDIAKRGAEDTKITFLLREAQLKFGRVLKSNEVQTLVWLYDDEGMDVSLILMLVQYAIGAGRCNIGYIEKCAVDWINKGISTISAAEAEIASMMRRGTAWNMLCGCFGIERRMPSTHEQELADLWINEWHMTKELLKAAYDTCVDAKSKFSMPYTAKILESWHAKGWSKPSDIEKSTPGKPAKSGYAAYDAELFEQMLNNK